jgi:hypothetical protein
MTRLSRTKDTPASSSTAPSEPPAGTLDDDVDRDLDGGVVGELVRGTGSS